MNKEYVEHKPLVLALHTDMLQQELMSTAKRRKGASNYRTLFVPSSVESRALNLAENAPYKVSSMFTPTSLRSQQVAQALGNPY